MNKFKFLHPKDEIIEIMNRIYQNGMTTTSGGNLSILDDDGSIWITPKGVDKGSLIPKDIIRVFPDGKIKGIHEPSSEYPFHLAIYKERPDIKAVLHAHPPSLVAFAITRRIPDTRIVPKASEICGKVGYAKYELPGSTKLGKVIAKKFSGGHNTVLMENHGIVTVGNSLMQAFQKLETLVFCARLTINAKSLGGIRILTEDELHLSRGKFVLEQFIPESYSSEEKEIRKELCKIIHRSYSQNLITSMEGTFSARVNGNQFIITPWGKDRKYLAEEDLVLIKGEQKEAGKKPSRSIKLHMEIYKRHKNLNAIFIAHPPNILAFAITNSKFDSRTIPESYLLLRDIPKLPFGMEFGKGTKNNKNIIDIISSKVPIVLCENDCILVTGDSMLQTFDRLEVAEYSAKSIIAAKEIGDVVPIQEKEIKDLEKAFNI